MTLIQRQTSIKREHYSAVGPIRSSAFIIPQCRQRIHARETGTYIGCGGAAALLAGKISYLNSWTKMCVLFHYGQNGTLGDSVCILVYNE